MQILNPQSKSKNKTLHTESDAIIFLFIVKFAVRDKMESSRSENDFVVLSLLHTGKRKQWVHPILENKTRARRVSPADKGAADYPDHFQVYFRMSVVQFDTLLAILEPHI